MSACLQRLENTGDAMREALTKRDWSMIGALDLQCRTAVEQAVTEGGDNELLRERMQQMLELYRELVKICQVERQRVADELRQLNQSQQGTKVYQLFS